MSFILKSEEVLNAARIIRRGGLLAFPTETVYGLGADATNDDAVAAIYLAKGRPQFNPLIIHVPDLETAEKYAVFSPLARKLATAFWPGPLTLALPLRKASGLSDLVTAGNDTVAIRVPAAPLAQDLLKAAACPVAAPSANTSGQLSPTTAAHVVDSLGDKIDAVLDGGPCDVGLESTIVGFAPFQILRQGGVPQSELIRVAGMAPSTETVVDDTAPSAPGQLTSHYAPQAGVILNATHLYENTIFIGFGSVSFGTLNLSPDADTTEAAKNLFSMMRQADALAVKKGAKTISVAPIPEDGLGAAINDRLRRAAAPRD